MEPGKVLISGVAGFIGSNLATYLLKEGWEVYGLDNLSTGSRENLMPLKENKKFYFYERDISQDLSSLNIQPEIIVHLAAAKIPRYGGSLHTLNTNTRGTENMLELARQNQAKFILASTSDVYGKSHNLPFREDGDLVLGPSWVRRWAYAASKLIDEHLALAYNEEFKLPVVVLRFFGGYGPGQNLSWTGGPQGVFIAASLRGERIPIHGDGKQTRTFIYIDDLIRAIYLAMTRAEALGQIINVGTEREVSIVELAKLIWSLCRQKGEPPLEFIPYSQFSRGYEDVRRRVPDISRAKEILGFYPEVELEDGLNRMIKWVKR